ncbi:hypothetical protein VTN77DRAFT_56 [Rasamsonia byssochlamydoides]|uniref:uncharacterized protein n=1 Tax=Rasamsonia byssochlamydoides TaxID=89139 RepID=UPI0037427560
MSTPQPTALPEVGRLVSVVPVGLKEAALDSPTFRATTLHFADQLELVERWLDGYAKAATKLTTELLAFEQAMGSLTSYATTPFNISEAVLDHDYTLLALKRHGDCVKDILSVFVGAVKKLEHSVAEPIRAFIQGDLRNFKETRRALDQAQKQYDHLQARYSAQTKNKEPSALREDAFQLHEARKAYLKASMDFCVQAPQVRSTLDKLLVSISFDQWRETKKIHENNVATFAKWGHDMDRVKGWVHEMENSERYSLKELLAARKQIEEAAEQAARPSRELDDYSVSTVPYLGKAPSAMRNHNDKPFKPEKQGWLNLRTLTGKPTRTVWVRRWAFLKNGIFGCLVQSSRTGGVEESERIGVLLCNIRPAFQEERRFCFEVKTKKNTIMLQAETQKELVEWIGAFEEAKKKALENPASTDLSVSGKLTVQDPAFSISQPPAPEFAADPSESLTPNNNGDDQSSGDRNGTLPVPERDGTRSSGDFGRRLTGLDGEIGNARDHASRIIQKLDLHRKGIAPGLQSPTTQPATPGGIASLISASHSLLPYGSPLPVPSGESDGPGTTTLAPPTLANPPAPTSMSKVAVLVSNERGIGVGLADSTGGMPSGMMANLWGSTNWGFLNTLQREGMRPRDKKSGDDEKSATKRSASPASDSKESTAETGSAAPQQPTSRPRHRQTVSLDGDASKLQRSMLGISHEYPSYYPQRLRIQDAQFRLLFPNVKREESLVLVFRATWNPNDEQEFPGRAFVTTRNMYFYSHHFGLVLTTSISLANVMEVTAAPGRDCDFLFLHLNPSPGDFPSRITVKTFIEPLRLLQKRLNFLIKEATSDDHLNLESILKTLIKMEVEVLARPPSVDSWEDLSFDVPDSRSGGGGRKGKNDLSAPIYIERDFDIDPSKSNRGRDIPKIRLPSQPVEYVPQGNLHLAAEKIFDISPKALFHVLFGDKSALWQLLLHERMAQGIKQGPWKTLDSGHMRRDFEYNIEKTDLLGRSNMTKVSDYQIIDVLNDHLCYVITDKKTPWHLPFRRNFRLVSKIVITYVSKSRSKLAIFTKVEWLWSPYVIQRVIDKQAMNDLEQDALDLVDLVSDQVRKLGPRSRTKKAITIFGHVGHQTNVFQFSSADAPSRTGRSRKQRSLAWLLLESMGSLLESAISSLMIWSFALLRWIWKTTSAHSLILALLFASLLINGFYSSRDAYEWWHERNAAKLMSRLGISEENVMSKAIYVRDLDEAISNTTGWHSNNTSRCFATFHEQTMLDDDVPLTMSTSGMIDAVERSASRRVQRTRQRLGIYRHDLVVALRVVNSIEREVLQSEWERWLHQETRRCRQVEALLKDGDGEVDASLQNQSIFAERKEDVARWYEDYCLSCQEEQERLSRGRAPR